MIATATKPRAHKIAPTPDNNRFARIARDILQRLDMGYVEVGPVIEHGGEKFFIVAVRRGGKFDCVRIDAESDDDCEAMYPAPSAAFHDSDARHTWTCRRKRGAERWRVGVALYQLVEFCSAVWPNSGVPKYWDVHRFEGNENETLLARIELSAHYHITATMTADKRKTKRSTHA